jgi:hypothetical protein
MSGQSFLAELNDFLPQGRILVRAILKKHVSDDNRSRNWARERGKHAPSDDD